MFLKNLRDIEATNKRGGMIKRVMCFVDLESDEFVCDYVMYVNVIVEDSNVVRLLKLGDLFVEDVVALYVIRSYFRRSRIFFSSLVCYCCDDVFDVVGLFGKFEFIF